MKKEKIIIKDITGDNAGYMWELEKEGYPAGTTVSNFTYRKENNACYFNNCVAYVGETCEFV